MVEPLFRADFDSTPQFGSRVTLSGPEGKHAVNVRRMRLGEGIQLSDGKGLRVRGEVCEISANSLAISVHEVISETPPQMSLTLVQALAKGDRDELAIQAATELGCWSVVPWQSDRSISKWDGPKIAKGVDRWQTIVSEAAKQSLRVFEPEVLAPVNSGELTALIKSFDMVLVLDPTSQVGISSVDLSQECKTVAVIVGPEGGISDKELANFEMAGALRVHMGLPILRTSTAGVAAIAVIQSKLGLWG